MIGYEIILCAGALYYLIDSWVMKLKQGAGFGIDKVIMLSGLVCLLILRLGAAEFMPDHQLAVDQEFNGIVEGGP